MYILYVRTKYKRFSLQFETREHHFAVHSTTTKSFFVEKKKMVGVQKKNFEFTNEVQTMSKNDSGLNSEMGVTTKWYAPFTFLLFFWRGVCVQTKILCVQTCTNEYKRFCPQLLGGGDTVKRT